jgi:hypothetical protein
MLQIAGILAVAQSAPQAPVQHMSRAQGPGCKGSLDVERGRLPVGCTNKPPTTLQMWRLHNSGSAQRAGSRAHAGSYLCVPDTSNGQDAGEVRMSVPASPAAAARPPSPAAEQLPLVWASSRSAHTADPPWVAPGTAMCIWGIRQCIWA